MQDFPTVSVVIPTFNSANTIEECIESILNQNYPKEKIEIIVIDDSTDSTPEILSRYPVNLIRVEKTNPSKKRNLAVKKSKGDIISFIDSDCVAEKNWIKSGVAHFSDSDVAIVGGPNLTHPNDARLARSIGLVYASPLGSAAMSARYSVNGFTPRLATETDLILCNMMISRKIFNELGGFDEELFPCEENELCHRARKKGYKLLYVPNMLVYHHHRPSISSFVLQLINYGRGRGELIKKHRDIGRPIFFIPSITLVLFLLALLSMIFGITLPIKIMSIVFVFYILGITAYSIKVSLLAKDIGNIPILIMLHVLLHLSYGIGMIKGLISRK